MDPILLLEKVFGADDSGYIPPRYINRLLKLSWSGCIPSDGIRALCWRVLLGLISPSDKSLWESQLSDMIVDYNNIKAKVMPSLDKVEIDPLSAMSSGNAAHEEWSIYYKNVDLITFISTDLERLYITGIPDEYFESRERRDMLLGILVIWSFHHPVISYRQGMHEMAAYVMYVIETELLFWNSLNTGGIEGKARSDPYGLLNVFSEQSVEANTYHIFARIMNELEPIYDPVAFTPRGAESQPFVVQFSTKVQEHYLRMLDSELCEHLEECHVVAQVYGIRWSRLMLGREFSVTNSVVFKLWDFIFAGCYEAETVSADKLLDEDIRPNINSMLASVRIAGHNQHSNEERRNITSMGTVKHESPNESSAPDAPQYVCTPLLGALGDLMLATMLNIRAKLLESDSCSVLGYLMHYPDMVSATPILEYADMIKRGVILGSDKEPTYGLYSRRKAHVPLRVNHTNSNNASSSANAWNLLGMKQRVTEKFNQVTLAMGSSLSEIVNNLADLSDDPDGSPQPPGAHPAGDSPPPVLRIVGGGNSAVKHTGGHPTTTSIPQQPDLHSSNNSTLSETAQKPVSSANLTEVDSEHSPVVFEAIEGDPLTGVLGLPTTNQLPTQSSVGPTPSSPVLTGKGTGYKNMPSDAVQLLQNERERDSISQSHFLPTEAESDTMNSPSITGYHLRKKIFTRGWLSSSKKDRRQGKRENRSSGGVNLHVLHSSLKTAAESESEEEDTTCSEEEEQGSEGGVVISKKLRTISKPKRSKALLKHVIGDRLLDLADSLVNPPYANLPATLTAGRELEYEVLSRRETVKRLRVMADVLAGLASLESYDARFSKANQSTASQANKRSATSPAVRQRAVPPSTMSPLPSVWEEVGEPSHNSAAVRRVGEPPHKDMDDDDNDSELPLEAQLIEEDETREGQQHNQHTNNTGEASSDHPQSYNQSISKESIDALKN